ncbi:MAG: hypothetical protein HYU41_10590 [Candidatus Rokubacteria bacterium]|nr:hypothetical protein [Candidatus Rokubacteria bacterium]
MSYVRDLRGYGGRPPDPKWPGGARLALSLVVNVEEGADLSVTAGDERNEAVYEVRDEVVGAPDPCMYVIDAIDWLLREGATAPKMLSVGLHLRIIGRPARIVTLERILDHVRERGQIWIATRAEIARHWRALHGIPGP